MPVKNSKNSSFKSEPIGTLENDCDKMYGMGSSYELNEEECEYAFLACKIIEENDSEIKEEMKNWYKTKEKIDVVSYKKEIENKGGDIESIINKFTRPDGGYIKQLKRHLNIDLNDFDYSYIKNKRERAKVLYFLYKIKVTYPDVNILELLSNQSMENIDFPSLQQKTYNGEFVHLIIDELEKEIDSETAIAIKSFFYSLHISLDNFLDNVLYYADAYCSEGKDDYAIDYINQKIQTISTRKYFIYNLDDFSPIEMMYFRILQYEHIGQVKDIIFVNNIKFDINCNISPSIIEEMKELAKCKIQIGEIENFINDTPKIARYVYLREDISENDIKKIRRQKGKAKQMINFLYRATPLKPVDFLLNKLHIISFLQAIILDEKMRYLIIHSMDIKNP